MRRLPILFAAAIVVVAAFSTGLPYLFFIVYMGLLVVGGSYVLTRQGLSGLEAGYAVNALYGHVGDQLRVTYTVRNTSRFPKVWLEVRNPTNLPIPLPGRAIGVPGWAERSWVARVPLARRGHYRIDPLHVRTGDPFGFFEASASVGQGLGVIVYPRIERLGRLNLPAAYLEGSRTAPVRTLQTTPLATTVRPYAPGDSFNRIHWKTTARHGTIQVKEFDLEQTADVWLFLDLQRTVQAGAGDDSTVEVGVRVAASVADRALAENRAVGLTTIGHRLTVVPPDRGARQRLKILQLLAAVEGDGLTPLAEGLVVGLSRLRRGMTAVVITPSLDPTWIRPLSTLRARGITCLVVALDARSFVNTPQRAAVPVPTTGSPDRADGGGMGAIATVPEGAARRALESGPGDDGQPSRALLHQLAEYQLRTVPLSAGVPLAEAFAA